MGKITLLPETTKNPITLIGKRAGICWGADISNQEKNYKRGLDCILSNHGRTLEYVNIEMVLEGYSARVIREWYTHIGGSPTRLQESTRYVNCDNFDYVTPLSIVYNDEKWETYSRIMRNIRKGYKELLELGVSKEDAAMILPLGMTTKIVDKRNLRNLADMSDNRLCIRAYWEYREIMKELCLQLSNYSEEWKQIINLLFKPKCEKLGYCPEKNSCGRYKQKEI